MLTNHAESQEARWDDELPEEALGNIPRELLDQAFFRGTQLMGRLEEAVTTFELEMGEQGNAFNILLKKTDSLDEKIQSLARKISDAKVQWARASLQAIELDMQQVSQFAQRIRSQDEDASSMEEDLAVLRENLAVSMEERDRLRELGVSVDEINRRIEAFDRAIHQVQRAIAGIKLGDTQAVGEPRVHATKWRSELTDLTQSALEIMRQVMSEDIAYDEVKPAVQSLRSRWEQVPEMPENADWLNASRMVGQLFRAESHRLMLHINAFLSDHLQQIHAQIEGAKMTDDPEDIPVLRENAQIFEENILMAALEIKDLPPGAQSKAHENLGMLLEEWRRFGMVIEETAQRLSIGGV